MLGRIAADPDQIARRGLIIAEIDTPGSGGRVDAAGQHQEPAGHTAVAPRSRAGTGANPRPLPVIAVLPYSKMNPASPRSRAPPRPAGLATAADGLTRRSSMTRSKSDAGCIPSVGALRLGPSGTGRTTYGVTMMTSSVSWR